MLEDEDGNHGGGPRGQLHDAARAEIEAWRGRCLNVFSRAEKAVTDSLLKARETDNTTRLEPLAGQRLNALEKLVSEQRSTESQKNALVSALSSWRKHDEKRPYFSHGIMTELIDRTGQWHVRVDFIAVQKGACEPRRMMMSKSEAEEFEAGLHAAFKSLSGQLGQLRKRIQPQTTKPA